VRGHLNKVRFGFAVNLGDGETTKAWTTWSRAIEGAAIEFMGLSGAKAKAFRGRGGPHIRYRSSKCPPEVVSDNQAKANEHSMNAQRLGKQAMRLKQWADRMKALRRPNLSDQLRDSYLTLNLQSRSLFLKHTNLSNRWEADLAMRTRQPCISHVGLIFVLQKGQEEINKAQLEVLELAKLYEQAEGSKLMENDKHNKIAFTVVRGKSSPPLLFAARDQLGPLGQAKGTVTTDPMEIDSIARRVWACIYEGNIKINLQRHADLFVELFRSYIYNSTPFQLDKISPSELMEVCTNGGKTAGGMDGWLPQDFAILPLEAFKDLAALLDAIELGHPWPSGVLHGRAAYLAKDEEPSLEVM
jgi:hypothetical protein